MIVLVGPAIADLGWLRRELRALARKSHPVLVGIDGGAERIQAAGLKPSLAVGDFDSLRRGRPLSGMPVVHLRADKDRSDLFYALEFAASWPKLRNVARLKFGRATFRNFGQGGGKMGGLAPVVAFGVTGGPRLDHHLASLYDLAEFAGRGGAVAARDPGHDYFFATPRQPVRLGLRRGTLVSVLPVGGPARGVMLRGFRFQPRRGVLPVSSNGLSNVATGSRCSIGVRQGKLVVVIPYSR